MSDSNSKRLWKLKKVLDVENFSNPKNWVTVLLGLVSYIQGTEYEVERLNIVIDRNRKAIEHLNKERSNIEAKEAFKAGWDASIFNDNLNDSWDKFSEKVKK